MNKRLVSVLAFALVLSAAATYLLYRLLGGILSSNVAPTTSKILVASHPLAVGALLRETDLMEADWAGAIPDGVLTKREDIVNRGVVAAIYSGEPIRADRLAPIGAGAGLSATIPVGMRAVAIRVNDVVSVAGFVTPGQRVDLLVHGNSPSGGGGNMSRTLLQNIEVLSAGQQIQKDNEGKPVSVPVVNLLVTPEQAETVSLVSNYAQIQLVLRNPMDKEDSKTSGAFYDRLFGASPSGPPPPSVEPRAPRVPRAAAPQAPPRPAPEVRPVDNSPLLVEIYNGASKDTKSFKKAEEK